jgi:hypothetical protein
MLPKRLTAPALHLLGATRRAAGPRDARLDDQPAARELARGTLEGGLAALGSRRARERAAGAGQQQCRDQQPSHRERSPHRLVLRRALRPVGEITGRARREPLLASDLGMPRFVAAGGPLPPSDGG